MRNKEYVWRPPTEIETKIIRHITVNLDDVDNAERRLSKAGVPQWKITLIRIRAKLSVRWHLFKYRKKASKGASDYLANLYAYLVYKHMEHHEYSINLAVKFQWR